MHELIFCSLKKTTTRYGYHVLIPVEQRDNIFVEEQWSLWTYSDELSCKLSKNNHTSLFKLLHQGGVATAAQGRSIYNCIVYSIMVT